MPTFQELMDKYHHEKKSMIKDHGCLKNDSNKSMEAIRAKLNQKSTAKLGKIWGKMLIKHPHEAGIVFENWRATTSGQDMKSDLVNAIINVIYLFRGTPEFGNAKVLAESSL